MPVERHDRDTVHVLAAAIGVHGPATGVVADEAEVADGDIGARAAEADREERVVLGAAVAAQPRAVAFEHEAVASVELDAVAPQVVLGSGREDDRAAVRYGPDERLHRRRDVGGSGRIDGGWDPVGITGRRRRCRRGRRCRCCMSDNGLGCRHGYRYRCLDRGGLALILALGRGAAIRPAGVLRGHRRSLGIAGASHHQEAEADLDRCRGHAPIEGGSEAKAARGSDIVSGIVAHQLPAGWLGHAVRPDLQPQLRVALRDGLEVDVDDLAGAVAPAGHQDGPADRAGRVAVALLAEGEPQATPGRDPDEGPIGTRGRLARGGQDGGAAAPGHPVEGEAELHGHVARDRALALQEGRSAAPGRRERQQAAIGDRGEADAVLWEAPALAAVGHPPGRGIRTCEGLADEELARAVRRDRGPAEAGQQDDDEPQAQGRPQSATDPAWRALRSTRQAGWRGPTRVGAGQGRRLPRVVLCGHAPTPSSRGGRSAAGPEAQGRSVRPWHAPPSGAATRLRQPGHLASRQVLGFAAPPRDGCAFLGSPGRMTSVTMGSDCPAA